QPSLKAIVAPGCCLALPETGKARAIILCQVAAVRPVACVTGCNLINERLFTNPVPNKRKSFGPARRALRVKALARHGPHGPPGQRRTDAEINERLEEASALPADLIAHYPYVPEYVAAYAGYLDRLGMILFDRGKFDQVEQLPLAAW